MIFAFLYGLSLDYEVFMLTRMREVYDETGDTSQAIAHGLSRTGKLVTSAALVLCLAFFVLSTGPGTDIKQFGIGLSAGVIFDATVIRALLVPSLMQLLGRWNWVFGPPPFGLHYARHLFRDGYERGVERQHRYVGAGDADRAEHGEHASTYVEQRHRAVQDVVGTERHTRAQRGEAPARHAVEAVAGIALVEHDLAAGERLGLLDQAHAKVITRRRARHDRRGSGRGAPAPDVGKIGLLRILDGHGGLLSSHRTARLRIALPI